jgi:hypothetical protein
MLRDQAYGTGATPYKNTGDSKGREICIQESRQPVVWAQIKRAGSHIQGLCSQEDIQTPLYPFTFRRA